MSISKAIEEFNSFKYKYDRICLNKQWNGYCQSRNAILVIVAEYYCNTILEQQKTNIHYHHNYFGSNRFIKWLNKYNLNFEWGDEAICFIYENKKNQYETEINKLLYSKNNIQLICAICNEDAIYCCDCIFPDDEYADEGYLKHINERCLECHEKNYNCECDWSCEEDN